MTIDEAIKITESILVGAYDHRDEDMEDALRLAIEALKAWQHIREGDNQSELWELAG